MTYAIITLILAMPVDTQKMVKCTKFGDTSGQIYLFERRCPLGFVRVR